MTFLAPYCSQLKLSFNILLCERSFLFLIGKKIMISIVVKELVRWCYSISIYKMYTRCQHYIATRWHCKSCIDKFHVRRARVRSCLLFSTECSYLWSFIPGTAYKWLFWSSMPIVHTRGCCSQWSNLYQNFVIPNKVIAVPKFHFKFNICIFVSLWLIKMSKKSRQISSDEVSMLMLKCWF